LQAKVTDDLITQLRLRSKAERKLIGEAMNAVVANWGHPHRHSGIGIRRLTKSIFECRIGLDQRLAFVFVATPPELLFFFLGNHDDIQRLIRSSR
jgi:mRNA-degrading endonuclease YafQ of YafQ-DinJ toxin-antitoxin module